MKPGVIIQDPGQLCAAGHVAAEIISRNLARPDLRAGFDGLDLVMHFLAGRMKFTVVFRGREVEVMEGHEGKASVTVRGPVSALLKLANRKLPWYGILTFKVYVFGNYFKFLKAAPLLQVHEPVPPELLEGG